MSIPEESPMIDETLQQQQASANQQYRLRRQPSFLLVCIYFCMYVANLAEVFVFAFQGPSSHLVDELLGLLTGFDDCVHCFKYSSPGD